MRLQRFLVIIVAGWVMALPVGKERSTSARVVPLARTGATRLADADQATAETLRLALIGRELDAQRARLEAGFAELEERQREYDALEERLERRADAVNAQLDRLIGVQHELIRRRRELARELGSTTTAQRRTAVARPRRHL